jgi:tetratricopeptide (TPR) repeat protein
MAFRASSQDPITDSLQALLKTEKNDTARLRYLFQISDAQDNAGNYDEGIKYSLQSVGIAEEILKERTHENSAEIQTIQKYLGKAYGLLGILYRNKSISSEALKYHAKALRIREELQDKKGIAASYNNIGNVHEDLGNYAEALKQYLESLKMKEAIGDKKGSANSYNNIGNVYNNLQNYPEAIKNHLTALKLREEINDRKGIASSYNNIGNIYFEQAQKETDPLIKKIKLELSLKNHFFSRKISMEIGDARGLANSYINIGGVYHDQALLEKDPEGKQVMLNKAMDNFSLSLKLRDSIGDRAGVAAAYTNLGMTFLKLKKYPEARQALLKSKALATEVGFKECLMEIYNTLMHLDSTSGNFKGAYENLRLYILYRDSLDNEETRKKTIQAQMSFEFEKKEAVATAEHQKEMDNQKVLSEEKSKKQKIVLALVSCFLLLVIGFSAFIFRSLRLTKKQKSVIEQQMEIVEKQKLEVERQKHLVEDHQKEIIDSIKYAKRIQQSQLPTENYIHTVLKKLRKKEY